MSETGKPGLALANVPGEGDFVISDEDSIEALPRCGGSVIVDGVVAGFIG